MSGRDIRELMLSDPQGRAAVDAACIGEDGEQKSPEWMARNRVAWFGQRITVGHDWRLE